MWEDQWKKVRARLAVSGCLKRRRILSMREESEKSTEENLVERVSQLSLFCSDSEMASMRSCCSWEIGSGLEWKEKKPMMRFGDRFESSVKKRHCCSPKRRMRKKRLVSGYGLLGIGPKSKTIHKLVFLFFFF